MSIWLVTSGFAMIVLVGLAVDLGGQVHAQQRARNLAAQAARTGGQQLQPGPAIRGESGHRGPGARRPGRPHLPGRRRRRPAPCRSPAATPSP